MTQYIVPQVPTFHWADYLIFAMSLALSAIIGFYFGFVEKKQKTTKDFLVGGKQMKPFPVALSLLASFLSAPFIIGIPAEMYVYGTMYAVITLGYILATPITVYCFIPVFHNLDITSSYEVSLLLMHETVHLLKY